jgi:hypothetical protein
MNSAPMRFRGWWHRARAGGRTRPFRANSSVASQVRRGGGTLLTIRQYRAAIRYGLENRRHQPDGHAEASVALEQLNAVPVHF